MASEGDTGAGGTHQEQQLHTPLPPPPSSGSFRYGGGEEEEKDDDVPHVRDPCHHAMCCVVCNQRHASYQVPLLHCLADLARAKKNVAHVGGGGHHRCLLVLLVQV